MKLRKNTWLITKSQIGSGDIDSAIFPVDPEQIPDAEIFGLHGGQGISFGCVPSLWIRHHPK